MSYIFCLAAILSILLVSVALLFRTKLPLSVAVLGSFATVWRQVEKHCYLSTRHVTNSHYLYDSQCLTRQCSSHHLSVQYYLASASTTTSWLLCTAGQLYVLATKLICLVQDQYLASSWPPCQRPRNLRRWKQWLTSLSLSTVTWKSGGRRLATLRLKGESERQWVTLYSSNNIILRLSTFFLQDVYKPLVDADRLHVWSHLNIVGK